MITARLAVDPLWQCLCPAWAGRAVSAATRCTRPAARPQPLINPPRRPLSTTSRAQANPGQYTWGDRQAREAAKRLRAHAAQSSLDDGDLVEVLNPLRRPPVSVKFGPKRPDKFRPPDPSAAPYEFENIEVEGLSTERLYRVLSVLAVDGRVQQCQGLVEHLVRKRREQPNLELYKALILSNLSHEFGAAWRVALLLQEMDAADIRLDAAACHAVLKVLAVHPDHLLRSDLLAHMRERYIDLDQDGMHDVAAGLLREGLIEQGLQMVDRMRNDDVAIHGWLLDMAVYALCNVGEVDEAYRVIRVRCDDGDWAGMSKYLWWVLLEHASEARHYDATLLAWNANVEPGFINPPSGVCINVLATMAQAGDRDKAQAIVNFLVQRGERLKQIHYELLMTAYVSGEEPDLPGALTVLTGMTADNVEVTKADTRALFEYLRNKPDQVGAALTVLGDLHEQGKRIPLAALNMLIECRVDQREMDQAVLLYKRIHTFVPRAEGARKIFANVDTFNVLLRGCRLRDPPDAAEATFFVTELLALRVRPNALTFDRLMLVFIEAAKVMLRNGKGFDADSSLVSSSDNPATGDDNNDVDAADKSVSPAPDPAPAPAPTPTAAELLDWAYRHCSDMRTQGWLPRGGTLRALSLAMAEVGDPRCWDMLQLGADNAAVIGGWRAKGDFTRRDVEAAWAAARGDVDEGDVEKGDIDGGAGPVVETPDDRVESDAEWA